MKLNGESAQFPEILLALMRQTAVKNSQRQNRLSVNRHVSMTVKGYGSGRRFLCFSYGHRQFNILDPLFFPCIRQRDLQHGVSGRQIASEVPLKPGISGGQSLCAEAQSRS